MVSAEDKVVAEFDVHVCNKLLGSQTQLLLFQYPLRPPWRPYDLADGSTKLRIKPKARRVELSVPMDVRSENYHYGADEALRLSELTLRSRPTELETSVAIGVFSKGKLLLLPIDAAHRLRPALDHLEVPVTRPTGQVETKEIKSDPESDVATVVLQQQVKKRETERQAQARLRSFAHMDEAEAKEAWVDIDLAAQGAEEGFFMRLSEAPSEQLRTTLSRETYLSTLIPDPSTLEEDAGRAAAAARRAAAEASTSAPAAAPGRAKPEAEPAEPLDSYSGPPLSANELKLLKKTMMVLLRNHPVVKLRGIRWWIANCKHEPQDNLNSLITGSDAMLHHAVQQAGLTKYVREVYVQTKTESADVDKFREALLELLSTRPAVRKQEVMKAAKAKGLKMSDTQYTKAFKEVCTSRAALWSLRGAFAGRT